MNSNCMSFVFYQFIAAIFSFYCLSCVIGKVCLVLAVAASHATTPQQQDAALCLLHAVA